MTCYDCPDYNSKLYWCKRHQLGMPPQVICIDTEKTADKPVSNRINKLLDKPVPRWFRYLMVFAATFFVTSAISYFIDLTGVIVGLLSVYGYREMEKARGVE